MAIRRDTLRLVRRLRVTVGTEADNATRTLTKAWVSAWDELDGQWRNAMDDAIAYAAAHGHWPQPWEIARIERLRAALEVTTNTLTTLGRRTGVEVTDAAGNAVHATADAEPHILASQLPAAERAAAATRFADRAFPHTLDVIVGRTAQQITVTTWPLSSQATDAMRRELVRGIAVGANPRESARRMVARVQGTFDGGLVRATNIARTETLDAYRATSRYLHTANRDVLAGWTWLSARDRRTCPSCWAMDGGEHPVDEQGPEDHQQGRCTRVAVVRPWRELGIGLDEPPSMFGDARATFAGLPEDDQVAIMGPARLDLLRSGRIGWDDLATKRSTTGWRDSWTPTPVRDLERRASVAA